MNFLNKLRIIGASRDKLLAGPRSIYIDINTKCNINCNYCWIHSPLNKKPVHKEALSLTFEDIKKIVDKATEWNSEEVVISGDGEPTIHSEFKQITEYITKRGFKTFLTTNATFKEKLLPVISKIDYLYMTFSAPEKKLYNEVQSPNSQNMYERVIKNIKILSLLKKKHRKPFLNIAFIINSTNYKTISQMLNLGEKIGIDEITFRIMEPTEYTKKLLLSNREKKELLKIINKTTKKTFGFIHNLQDIKNGILNHKESVYNIRQCFTGWFNIFVDFNKNVGLCCHNENLIIGNLKNKSIEKIWESKKAHDMRLLCKYKFNISKYPFKGECEWCYWHKENKKIIEEIKRLRNVKSFRKNNF